jgi:hypothetical protein
MSTALLTPITSPHRAHRVAVIRDAAGRQLATLACDSAAGQLMLGRGPAAALALADRAVSRLHAVLAWDPVAQMHVLTDLGSSNGTFVNGQRITGPVGVLNGTTIQLGNTQLRYERWLGDGVGDDERERSA